MHLEWKNCWHYSSEMVERDSNWLVIYRLRIDISFDLVFQPASTGSIFRSGWRIDEWTCLEVPNGSSLEMLFGWIGIRRVTNQAVSIIKLRE
jgi:hypothetical protein